MLGRLITIELRNIFRIKKGKTKNKNAWKNWIHKSQTKRYEASKSWLYNY